MNSESRPLSPHIQRFAWACSEALAKQVLQIMYVIEEYDTTAEGRWRLLRSSLERFANDSHQRIQDDP